MANLTITIEKKETKTESVELPIPFFFRNKEETQYIGMLDEKTVVELIIDTFETSIRNYNQEAWNAGKGRIEAAYSLKYQPCTETEFLQKFEEIIESLSLTPKVV